MGDMEKRILENLEKAGWHLKPATVGNIIRVIEDDEEDDAAPMNARELERRVRAELLDTDLSTTGARFLQDAKPPPPLRTMQTPCVLQVAAVRDVSKSNQGSGSTARLLQLRLTDGHSFLKAIEHRPIPALSEEISPGTKVTLLGLVMIHGETIPLEPNSIRIEGGHVAALHEAWVMQRKYAGPLSRSTTDGGSGPPPFRGLNTTTKGAQARRTNDNSGVTPAPSNIPSGPAQDIREQAGAPNRPTQDVRAQAGPSTNVEGTNVRLPAPRMRPGAEPYRPRGRQQNEANTQNDAPPVASGAPQSNLAEVGAPQARLAEVPVEKHSEPSASEPKAEGRVREKAPEVAPVQNRQAAQKLLDRRTDAGVGTERGRGRGRGNRRGGRYDTDEHDERIMTLDEWEAKKATPSSSRSAAVSDEELAMRLQEQFNLEGSHDTQPQQLSAAEQLRQSMFSYVPEPSTAESSRGRGRGRGAGRGRGRGRR